MGFMVVVLSLGSLALMGLTTILFFVWSYQAHENARLLAPGAPLSNGPGVMIWSYFIPFVNLFLPYSAMKEVFSASDAAARAGDDEDYRLDSTGGTLLSVGWIVYVGTNIIISAMNSPWDALVIVRARDARHPSAVRVRQRRAQLRLVHLPEPPARPRHRPAGLPDAMIGYAGEMIWILGVHLWSSAALAGEVALGLPNGGQRVGELVELSKDCSATLRLEDGREFHMSTESMVSAWFLEGLEDAEGRLIVPPDGEGLVQVQGLTDSLTVRIDGRIMQVAPGALVPLPPGSAPRAAARAGLWAAARAHPGRARGDHALGV
jgi:hypothetical protein